MGISELDRTLLARCEEIKRQSYDPERKVGAIIVDAQGQILATGANTPPQEMHLSREESLGAISADPNWKYFVLEHAERNAIRNARHLGRSVEGGTMYGTLFPCADCARAIVAAGIDRLVVPQLQTNSARDVKWQLSFKYAHEILERSGVLVEFADSDERSVSGFALRQIPVV